MHFAFSYEAQGYVCQLHQVAAGAYAAVARYERVYAAVDELGQQFHHRGMDARTALQKRAGARYHRALYLDVAQRLARACAVAADYVILQVGKVFVIHTPLGHGAETRVDTVYHLVLYEFTEELIRIGALAHTLVGGPKNGVAKNAG